MVHNVDSILHAYHMEEKEPYITKIDSNYFLLVNGFSYVFKWEGAKFENLYTGRFHGYNFGSYKFKYNNMLTSYGGYGFWAVHRDITYFEWDKGEWELIPVSIGRPDIESSKHALAFFMTQSCMFILR